MSKLYKHLRSKPTGNDLYESNAHSNLAESISELINNGKEKILGLEGEWGSGKSNVIEIIRNKLGDNYYIYIYDAWGHQEDLQRRSFLEEMTSELCNKNILKKENLGKWNEEIENLLSRRSREITKTLPKLNDTYLYIFLVCVLNLITNKFTTQGMKAFIPSGIENYIIRNFPDFIKVLLIFTSKNMPIFLYLVYLFNKYYKNFGFQKKYLKEELSKMLYIYKDKQTETTVATITSTKEPSVKEFKDWMSNVDIDLRKKLIIVFDNMDRLPPHKIKDLWSSIHTFFAENEYERIWTIIPFDRGHIRKAFGGENEIEKLVSDDFINKTFSIVYRVTPPITVDWKNYFCFQIKEAISNIKEDEVIALRSLYGIEYNEIRPRNIIMFINELVTLKMLWKENIPTKYLGLFIIHKNVLLMDPVKEIISKKFCVKSRHLFDDKEIEKYIPAILFNVDVEKSSQVILGREIELAIRDRNSEALRTMTEMAEFYPIFESSIVETENIENAVLCLNDNNDILSKNMDMKNQCYHVLANKLLNSPVNEIKVEEYYRILVENVLNLKNEIIEFLLVRFRNIEKKKAEDYFKAINELNNISSENSLTINIFKMLQPVGLEQHGFINFVELAGEKWISYNVYTNWNLLENYYMDKLVNNKPYSKDMELIKVILMNLKVKFADLKKQLEINIANEDLEKEKIENTFVMYFNFVNKGIKTKLTHNKIGQYLYELREDTNQLYYILFSIYLSKKMLEDIEVNNTTYKNLINNIINTAGNEKLVQEICKYLEYFIDFGNILIYISKNPLPLIKECGKYLIENIMRPSTMNVISVLEKYDEIKANVSTNTNILIKRLSQWDISKNINKDNVFDILKTEKLFLDCKDLKLRISEHLISVYLEYFEQLNHEIIVNELKSDVLTYKIKILTVLLKEGHMLKINENLKLAYNDYLYFVDEIPEVKKEILNLIYEKINKNSVKSNIKNIRDKYINNVNMSVNTFLFFIPLFEEHGKLKEKNNDVLRRIITPQMTDKACIDSLLNNKEFYLELINSSDNSEKISFVDKIKSSKYAEEQDVKEFIGKIDIEELEIEE